MPDFRRYRRETRGRALTLKGQLFTHFDFTRTSRSSVPGERSYRLNFTDYGDTWYRNDQKKSVELAENLVVYDDRLPRVELRWADGLDVDVSLDTVRFVDAGGKQYQPSVIEGIGRRKFVILTLNPDTVLTAGQNFYLPGHSDGDVIDNI